MIVLGVEWLTSQLRTCSALVNAVKRGKLKEKGGVVERRGKKN